MSLKEAFKLISEAFSRNSDVATNTDKVKTKEVPLDECIEARGTYMKDLGQMFKHMYHSDAVKKRHSIAQTLKLIPSANNLSQWVDQNKDNAVFREKLGLH